MSLFCVHVHCRKQLPSGATTNIQSPPVTGDTPLYWVTNSRVTCGKDLSSGISENYVVKAVAEWLINLTNDSSSSQFHHFQCDTLTLPSLYM